MRRLFGRLKHQKNRQDSDGATRPAGSSGRPARPPFHHRRRAIARGPLARTVQQSDGGRRRVGPVGTQRPSLDTGGRFNAQIQIVFDSVGGGKLQPQTTGSPRWQGGEVYRNARAKFPESAKSYTVMRYPWRNRHLVYGSITYRNGCNICGMLTQGTIEIWLYQQCRCICPI